MNALMVGEVLLKWTMLLALGWAAHGLLRRRHPCWRLFLWRGIFCASLLVPLVAFVPLPVLNIPIFPAVDFPNATLEVMPTAVSSNLLPQSKTTVSASVPTRETKAINGGTKISPAPTVSLSISGSEVLASIWVLGAIVAGIRLVRLQHQLNGLRRESHRADPALGQRMKDVQDRLGVRRAIGIQVSDAISSPFACGLWQPMILLPRKMAETLSDDEAAALLAHEVAHFRRNDLFWCVSWRWVQAVFWFHPLVWNIPAAHNLACEQEADRLASGQLAEGDRYAQLLARLALRVLAVPPVETQLVLNGTSQIAERLDHLEKGKSGTWRFRNTLAGVGLVALLLLVATGCHFSRINSVAANTPANLEFKTVLVTVQDENGQPIQGASIQPDGFRVKGIHGADAYSWNKELFGPAEKVVTDAAGKCWLKYPVESIPGEKEFTRSLIFSVYQPEYSTVRMQDYPVDETNAPIQMTRGIVLEVTGYFGPDKQRVTGLVPSVNGEELRAEDWQKKDNGVYTYSKLSPGGHLVWLMGRLPSGEIVYSDTVSFTAERGKVSPFAMEMKPGIRLEGRLDEQVARPIKNGRVMISVRPKEYPAMMVIDDFYALDKTNGGRNFWHSYRPINEDGSFVFESVPPGEVDIFVLGDGFTTKSVGQLQNRSGDTLRPNNGLAIPQVFPLLAPVTKVEVVTEPTATLEFMATTRAGKPIAGVSAGFYPTVFRMRGMAGWQKDSSETPYRQMPLLSDLNYDGKTDKAGRLVIQNFPAEHRGLDVYDDNYQVPLQDLKGWRDRHLRTTYVPGQTNRLTIAMEPKGTDFIGSGR